MNLKIASHRLSYLASFSYFLFSSVALAHANTLFPDSKIKILLVALSGAYALFSAIAFIHLLRPYKTIDSPAFSAPVQRGIRLVALAVPLPFVLLFGAVLAFSGIACGAGFTGELFESIGQYDLAKASYNQRLQFHRALDSKQVICDLATLGSICDKQKSYGQADQFYQEAERLTPFAMPLTVVKEDPFHYTPPPTFEAVNAAEWQEQPWAWRNKRMNPMDHWATAKSSIALPRILRLLNQIPEAKAKNEFEFAAWAFSHKGESSLMLGKHIAMVDLRPTIFDVREAPPDFADQLESASLAESAAPSEAPQTVATARAEDESKNLQDSEQGESNPNPEQSSGTIGPSGGDATCVAGVSCAGYVIHGEQLRIMLGKISREKALANFDFASKFYPVAQLRHMRESFPRKPLPGTFLKPTTVSELIPDLMVIMGRDEYAKLYWLGKNADSVANLPREIDVVFTIADASCSPKAEWIDWIKKRAKASEFTARVWSEKAASLSLPGELRFSLDKKGIKQTSNCGSAAMESSTEADQFDFLKSSFDDGLRDHAWLFYSKPETLEKRTRIQLFVESNSDPIDLSERDLKRILAKGRSLGLTVTYQNDRDEGALFSREELDHWGETAIVSVSLQNGIFSTSVSGRIAMSCGWGYQLSSKNRIVENIEQSIELSAKQLTTNCDLLGDSFSSVMPSSR